MASRWLKVVLGAMCAMMPGGMDVDSVSAAAVPLQIIEVRPSNTAGEAYIIVKNTSTEPFMLISSYIRRQLPLGVWVMPNMTLNNGRVFEGLEEVKLVAASGTLMINQSAGAPWAYVDYKWVGEEEESMGRVDFGDCLAGNGWREGTVCYFEYEIIGGVRVEDGEEGGAGDDDNDDVETGKTESITEVDSLEREVVAAAGSGFEGREDDTGRNVLALVSNTGGEGIAGVDGAVTDTKELASEMVTRTSVAAREIDYYVMARGRLKALMVVLMATCLLWAAFGFGRERRGNTQPRRATI